MLGGGAGAGDQWLLAGSHLHVLSFVLQDSCNQCVCTHCPAMSSNKRPGHLLIILPRLLGQACTLWALGQVLCGERHQPGRARCLRCTCCPAFLPGCAAWPGAAHCMLLDV